MEWSASDQLARASDTAGRGRWGDGTGPGDAAKPDGVRRRLPGRAADRPVHCRLQMPVSAAVDGPVSVPRRPATRPPVAVPGAAGAEFRAEPRENHDRSARTGHGACPGPGSLLPPPNTPAGHNRAPLWSVPCPAVARASSHPWHPPRCPARNARQSTRCPGPPRLPARSDGQNAAPRRGYGHPSESTALCISAQRSSSGPDAACDEL